MKVHLDCIPCFQRQALEAARFVTDDEKTQERILRTVVGELHEIEWERSPPEIARMVHRVVKRVGKTDDPYEGVKRFYNDVAMEMYPDLKERVKVSDDSLLTAVRLAIAGNVIDFGANSHFNLEMTVSEIMEKEFRIFHFSRFVEKLKRSRSILFLADNAGEIVFDRILLETILDEFVINRIKFAVKGDPILNDATEEDARYTGMGGLPGLDIITLEPSTEGEGLEDGSESFLDLLAKSDMTISKGQGNYEALSGKQGIFFLLMAKCPVIAGDLGVEIGDIILKGDR